MAGKGGSAAHIVDWATFVFELRAPWDERAKDDSKESEGSACDREAKEAFGERPKVVNVAENGERDEVCCSIIECQLVSARRLFLYGQFDCLDIER